MGLIKVYDGYIIKIGKNYISDYRRGVYSYTTDYTYAKHYSEKTARNHIIKLSGQVVYI